MKKILFFYLLLLSHNAFSKIVLFEDLVKNSGLPAETTFEKYVMQSSTPVVIDYFAPWCPMCKIMAPIFNAVANDPLYTQKVTFIKVNYDASKTIIKSQKVHSLPYFGFYKNGKKVQTLIGKKSEKVLRSTLEQHLL